MPHRVYVDELLQPLRFDDTQERNLLDSLEKQGVEMDSHCRAGFCGTCRVRLLRGKVRYPGGPPLACLRENDILPCCCEPVTDIEIQRNTRP